MTRPSHKRVNTDPGAALSMEPARNTEQERDAARAYLRRTDNLDVAEALGLDPTEETT